MTQDEILDPQAFIDKYGPDTPVVAGDSMEITLGQAIEAERVLCPADAAARQDPRKRVGYLANMLASAGSLLPEDEHYLALAE